MRNNCLPPACPVPIRTISDYQAPCSDEYGAGGIFGGDVRRSMLGTVVATSCGPGRVLNEIQSGTMVGYARVPAATMIPQRCPPDDCLRPCPPQVLPLPADDQGRPIPPHRMPVRPPPVPIAPPPGVGPGGRNWRLDTRPLPAKPRYYGQPIPTPPPVGARPLPGYPWQLDTRLLPAKPRYYARPIVSTVRPSLPPIQWARPQALPRKLDGFGLFQLPGGGIFTQASSIGDIAFARVPPAQMMPPGCPPPAPRACPGAAYPAPVVSVPSRQPCPAPLPPCPAVPSYEIVAPEPATGCGWYR